LKIKVQQQKICVQKMWGIVCVVGSTSTIV